MNGTGHIQQAFLLQAELQIVGLVYRVWGRNCDKTEV